MENVIALVSIADAATVCSIAYYNEDLARTYQWNSSILDVMILALLRLLIVALLRLLRPRSTLALSSAAAVFGSCAVFNAAKLAAAHGLHDGKATVLMAIWVGIVCSVIEGVLIMLNSQPEQEQSEYVLLEEQQGASFRRVLALAWPERYLLAAAMVCLFVSSASQMIVPTLFGKIINTISKSHSQEELNHSVAMLVVLFVVSSVFSMFRGALFNLSGERLVARFRVRLFDAVLSQDIAFFDANQSGELQSRLSNDTTVIQDAVTSNISMGLRWLAQVVVGIAILFFLSPELTGIMLLVVPAIAIGARQYGMYVKGLSKAYQDALAKGAETAEQAFGSIRTVRSFSKETYEIEEYRRRIMNSYDYGFKKAWAYGAFIGVIGLAAYLAVCLVLWYGGGLVIKGGGKLDSAKLTSFLLYTIYIAFALGGLSGLYSQLMSAVGASERMFALIDRTPTIATDKYKTQQDHRVNGKVEFENVSFTYPTRSDMQVLQNVSFTCTPGNITALVGPSGGGKSTIVSLLLRFYDPTAGAILIDGENLKTWNTVKLHSIIGVVSQQPTLFATTIEENIRYGLHKNVTREQVETAARQANAWEFIDRFPDKLDTIVGERGVTLSGGQKQRIAIARALIGSPQILLLDEATSALDAESEYLVQDALDSIMSGRTTLVIAHRLSTVRNADNILVVEQGSIVQRGTHQQLMDETDGLYAGLVSRQLSHA
mmetsp:Transcript_14048/g.24888  ORF Transcript_14048/g.24888 Transcript_14048/m.24888 type:complete len:715 (+) Transcript_14048:5084-7228(+)